MQIGKCLSESRLVWVEQMRKGERPSNKPTLITGQKLKVLSGKIVKKLVKLFLKSPHTSSANNHAAYRAVEGLK